MPVRNESPSSVLNINRIDVYRLAEPLTAPQSIGEEDFASRAIIVAALKVEDSDFGLKQFTYRDALQFAGDDRLVVGAGKRRDEQFATICNIARENGKPVGILQHIGRRPIAAFGNSDGDLQMLQWTCIAPGPRFCLFVHHTDADREWAYDRESHIGRFDAGLDEAKRRGWTVVGMKNDWNKVFPFQ